MYLNKQQRSPAKGLTNQNINCIMLHRSRESWGRFNKAPACISIPITHTILRRRHLSMIYDSM